MSFPFGSRTMGLPAWVSSMVSLFVVLLATLYVVMPTGAGVELTVEEVSSDTPYDEVALASYSPAAQRVAARPRYRERIYGVVANPANVPVKNARLVIKGATRKLRKHKARIKLPASNTTYRATVRLKPGRYRFTVRLKAAGTPRVVSRKVRVRNHRAYRASVRVSERGVLTMLPITSY